MKTGHHTLSLTLCGENPSPKRDRVTGRCSCGGWTHPKDTRPVIREAHGEHLQECRPQEVFGTP